MKKLLIGLTLLTSLSIFAHENHFDLNVKGEIEFEVFEEKMSPGFEDAEVKIVEIKKGSMEYNLFEIFFGSNYDEYKLKIILDGEHRVECRLINILDKESFMILDCESKTIIIDHNGFIDYEELGLK